ncbi:MAG TPA: hypothetical protein VNE63_20525 [Candidatus Acidoferrales bacterium]|nr:hypothetical protein [Candidatus Acidoferrales bacterium]
MAFENIRHGAAYQSLLRCALVLVVALAGIHTAGADNAAFDLTGPRIEMTVSRAGKTLPIADVPNLRFGDRLWIHPDFPEAQSAHYLLIVAFLRGSTNPPPENWFTRAETWNKQVREEGIVVTVPKDAQQALLFLAPETDGGFSTLRSTVRSKPGTFVRASQDLNQAGLDRSRLEKYLREIKGTSDYDPKALQQRSVLLARTLNIKLDQECFDKPTEQQAPCLTQDTSQLVLDDGHSQSMVAALTSGPSSDLIGAISSTSVAGGGFYSPYVGAVVDLARLMGSFHTAEYQYIPALALPKQEQLNLRLNNPPSFHKPMSVLVVGLPAVEAAQLPPLRAVDPDQVFCVQRSPLVLPVSGAPLVFSTDIAHDFRLHLQGQSGKAIDLPATADPARGGFVVDTDTLKPGALESDATGTLQGYWGFETFEGPRFHLQSAHPATWTISPADQSALIVGREDIVHVESGCAVCVDRVAVQDEQGKELNVTWKLIKPDELEVHVPLLGENAGRLKLTMKQVGLATPDELPLHSYAEAARLDRFTIHAGDPQGVLIGTRLDEVNSFELAGIHFVPAKLSRAEQKDELSLAASASAPDSSLQPDEKILAHVALKDGRVLELQTTVAPPRPKVTLINKSIQPGPAPSPIHLGNQDDLPQNGRMSFFLKTEVPENFPQGEKIEIATTDSSFDTLLSVADGTLILQDSQTVLAKLDPAKSFGPSGFGQLRFRAVAADGGEGDWQPLTTLVRIPSLKEVRCPDSPDEQCKLSGTNLFLIDSVASDAQFSHTISVPRGFVDSTLSVPRPNGTLLYIKLRDDPSTVNTLVLPVLPDEQ